MMYSDLPEVPPYEGAKNYFLIEDVDDREVLTKLTIATYEELPEPKQKPRKTKNARRANMRPIEDEKRN